jgi:uncharacterized protein YeaO (DUF488 family)
MAKGNQDADRIKIKRAYEEAEPSDGYRVLVDRLWPRGVKKENLKLDEWAKEIAPSPDLRKWFGHDPARWEEFYRRYSDELSSPERHEILERLARLSRQGPVTLVYGAKDEEHNDAVVIRDKLVELIRTAAGAR